MAIFKCVHTGCVYELTDEQTIEDMRKHAEYEEIVDVPAPVLIVKPIPKPKKVKGELA
jgi:hypothetical protein|tara:strand:+ start:330 stop:503 length:174 start_codon:yes stop_codon:yes gene_type:complete